MSAPTAHHISYCNEIINYNESSQFKTVADCIQDIFIRLEKAESTGDTFWAGMCFSFLSETEADEFIAMFPKYVRLRKGGWSSHDNGITTRGKFVGFNLDFMPNRDGSKNEAGRTRLMKFIQVLTQE